MVIRDLNAGFTPHRKAPDLPPNREIHRQHGAKAAVAFREYGALNVVKCWGDDVPEGKLTSFPMAVKREADETVVFSWVTWPSR